MIINRIPLSEDEILAFIRRIGNGSTERISYRVFINFMSFTSSSPSILRFSSPSRKHSPSANRFFTPPIDEDELYLNYAHHISSPIRRKSNYNSPSRSTYKTNTSQNYITPPRNDAAAAAINLYRSEEISPPRSQMRGNEEEHLVLALKEQIVIDRDIEDIKKQLSLRNDFNLMDSFRQFDS